MIEDDLQNLKEIPASDVKFTTSHGNAEIENCVATTETGHYTCQVSNKKAETVHFITDVTGATQQKNADVTFKADCRDANTLSIVLGANPTSVVASGTDSTTLRVDVNDTHGNECPENTTLTIEMNQSGNPSTITEVSTYIFSAVSENIGTTTYTATVTSSNGSNKDSNSVDVVFTRGPVDAAHSKVEALESNSTVDNKVVVKVTLYDEYDHLVTDLDANKLTAILAGSTEDDNTSKTTIEKNVDNTYTFNVGSTLNQTVTVSVNVDDNAATGSILLEQKPEIRFDVGVVDHDRSFSMCLNVEITNLNTHITETLNDCDTTYLIYENYSTKFFINYHLRDQYNNKIVLGSPNANKPDNIDLINVKNNIVDETYITYDANQNLVVDTYTTSIDSDYKYLIVEKIYAIDNINGIHRMVMILTGVSIVEEGSIITDFDVLLQNVKWKINGGYVIF